MMTYTRYCLVAGGLLSGCSAPETPISAYPQNAAVSSPTGVPRDLATKYFPASANVNNSQDSLLRRMGDCEFAFQLASRTLFGFKAPVLSNYYLGHSIYRLLWSPGFRPPVLLTLELNEVGGVLRTKFVNRYPYPRASFAEVAVKSEPEIRRINQLKSLINAGQEVSANTESLASAVARLNEIHLYGTPLLITEKVVALNRDQIRQFSALLNQANIWQLPSCAPDPYFAGVKFRLEAHEAQRYKVISSINPPETDSFSKCCQFLLNLSSAKAEARY